MSAASALINLSLSPLPDRNGRDWTQGPFAVVVCISNECYVNEVSRSDERINKVRRDTIECVTFATRFDDNSVMKTGVFDLFSAGPREPLHVQRHRRDPPSCE
jgi:hypothetical protein